MAERVMAERVMAVGGMAVGGMAVGGMAVEIGSTLAVRTVSILSTTDFWSFDTEQPTTNVVINALIKRTIVLVFMRLALIAVI